MRACKQSRWMRNCLNRIELGHKTKKNWTQEAMPINITLLRFRRTGKTVRNETLTFYSSSSSLRQSLIPSRFTFSENPHFSSHAVIISVSDKLNYFKTLSLMSSSWTRLNWIQLIRCSLNFSFPSSSFVQSHIQYRRVTSRTCCWWCQLQIHSPPPSVCKGPS